MRWKLKVVIAVVLICVMVPFMSFLGKKKQWRGFNPGDSLPGAPSESVPEAVEDATRTAAYRQAREEENKLLTQMLREPDGKIRLNKDKQYESKTYTVQGGNDKKGSADVLVQSAITVPPIHIRVQGGKGHFDVYMVSGVPGETWEDITHAKKREGMVVGTVLINNVLQVDMKTWCINWHFSDVDLNAEQGGSIAEGGSGLQYAASLSLLPRRTKCAN